MAIRLTQQQYLENVIKLYGDYYIYDKIQYVNSRTDIVVTCKKHGDFVIQAGSFAKGHGCHKCAQDKRIAGIKPMTTEEFIVKVREVHGDK
jgi:hypothetical protein